MMLDHYCVVSVRMDIEFSTSQLSFCYWLDLSVSKVIIMIPNESVINLHV